MKKTLLFKLLLVTLSLVMMLSCFVACDKEPADDGKGTTQNGDSANNGGNNADNGNKTPTTSTELSDMVAEINAFKAEDFEETTEKTEYLKVVVKDYGEIIIRLRREIAPSNVGGFQWLVQRLDLPPRGEGRLHPRRLPQRGRHRCLGHFPERRVLGEWQG